MDVSEQINLFYKFIEAEYYNDLVRHTSKGEKFLKIDFNALSKFNPELAEFLLEKPDEIIKAAELAVDGFDIEGDTKNFKIRFFNLPESQKSQIRNIRSSHLNKLLEIEGLVRQKSDVRPQVTSARFECPSCGNIISVLQLDTKFKEPSRCSCGRRGKFRLISKELVDAQKIVLEEAPEDLEGGEQPKRLSVFLKSDLVSPLSDKKTNPGSKIKVGGIIKEIPIEIGGVRTTRFDLFSDANNVEPIQEDFYDIDISEEEEAQILELANDKKVFEKIRDSLAPSIYGYEKVKEALLLQMLGGVLKKRDRGDVTRGDIHVLLVGDPGSGKSQLLKRISVVAPKSRYVSGKGATGAGLTATVVKDEFLRGWALEAGALVLTNKGICCTTEDSKFILENGQKMSFKELFGNSKSNKIYPKFRILGLNNKTTKIEPSSIKQAFRIKNDKKVYRLKTRTGKELNLTEDNELLTCKNSKFVWEETRKMQKGDFIAVPKNISIKGKDDFSEEFSYIAGLIASDGHIKFDKRHATTRFYNTNKQLIEIYIQFMKKTGYKCSKYIQKSGRKSIIRNKEVISKQNQFIINNSTKEFASKLIKFGISKGNKSTINPLDEKILSYSEKTIKNFLKGIFDGDGSIRLNPYEITLVSGIKENAILFQDCLIRLGIISSVKQSTNSWHCDIRGTNNCIKFFNLIGTNHHEKFNRLSKIKQKEVKDRIDVLPNHEFFFKKILKKYRWKMGKDLYKYFWNYSKKSKSPSIYKLKELNYFLKDPELTLLINNDILWDKITSIKEIEADYVYDFTMNHTNNFIANGIIMDNCIDELDKMTPEDQSAMHEGLEQQTITISKANIQATLRAETTVLAAANPKFGRFDPYELIAKQIELPTTLLNRFDLIFPMRDLPDKIKDEKLASFILQLHQSAEKRETEISSELIKKYVSYARRKIFPKITDSARKEIQEFFVNMRNIGEREEAIRTIGISPRQLEALIRLSEASAKAELRDKVLKKDAKRAIELVHYCLSQIGLDPDTGRIDIDRIATGISTSERSDIVVVREIITELEKVLGKTIPVEDIEREAEIKGIEKDKVDEIIEKLKRTGDIFSPRHGLISKI